MAPLFVRRCCSSLTAIALATLAAPHLSAQATGTVTGQVSDQASSQPIAGAQVYFPGLQLGALSNAQGRFLILNVPTGQREIRAELIGRQTVSQTVNVPAGGTVQVSFVLESRAISLEGVVVTGVAAATPRAQLAFTVDEVKVDPVTVATSINVGSMIQGRMAGAKIIQSNGALPCWCARELKAAVSVRACLTEAWSKRIQQFAWGNCITGQASRTWP